jgi:hypothetical protein
MSSVISLLDQAIAATNQAPSTNTLPEPAREVAQDYTGRKQEFFTVESEPLPSPYGGYIPGKRGLFVNQNNINIVSDKYEVHQPSEIYQTFANVAARTNLEINRVITNPTNGGLLLSAKFADTKIVGENHDVNVTFYTSHCGKYKTFLTLDLLRIACFNQVPCLYRNKQRFIFAEKHYQNALDINLMESKLEAIPESVEAYNEKARQLQDTKLSFNSFRDYYVDHYKLKESQKQFDSKVEKLREVYYNATGQRELANDSAYKAYQAITFFNTHELRDTAMREENILTKRASDSIVVLEELLAVA